LHGRFLPWSGAGSGDGTPGAGRGLTAQQGAHDLRGDAPQGLVHGVGEGPADRFGGLADQRLVHGLLHEQDARVVHVFLDSWFLGPYRLGMTDPMN
jgi:hypothetical protein